MFVDSQLTSLGLDFLPVPIYPHATLNNLDDSTAVPKPADSSLCRVLGEDEEIKMSTPAVVMSETGGGDAMSIYGEMRTATPGTQGEERVFLM